MNDHAGLVSLRRAATTERCEQPEPGHSAVHSYGAIAVYRHGEGQFWMGGTWALQAGDVLLVPDGTPHHRLDRHAVDWVGLSLCPGCMPSERWGAGLRRLFDGVRRGACPVLRPEPSDFSALLGTLDALDSELSGQRPGRELAIDGLLGLVCVTLLRASPAHRDAPDGDTPLVTAAMAWVSAHATESISLVDVAQAVGRAPTYLAAVVKEQTGHPVGHWIAEARMAVARDLLLRSDDNVAMVAERVGYGSPSHFHRSFRERHALTPHQWREQHRRGRAS